VRILIKPNQLARAVKQKDTAKDMSIRGPRRKIKPEVIMIPGVISIIGNPELGLLRGVRYVPLGRCGGHFNRAGERFIVLVSIYIVSKAIHTCPQ
jgi:hypothetical protein